MQSTSVLAGQKWCADTSFLLGNKWWIIDILLAEIQKQCGIQIQLLKCSGFHVVFLLNWSVCSLNSLDYIFSNAPNYLIVFFLRWLLHGPLRFQLVEYKSNCIHLSYTIWFRCLLDRDLVFVARRRRMWRWRGRWRRRKPGSGTSSSCSQEGRRAIVWDCSDIQCIWCTYNK